MIKTAFLFITAFFPLVIMAQDTIVIVKDCEEISTYFIGNTKHIESKLLDCFWETGADTTYVVEDCIEKTILQKKGHKLEIHQNLPCFWEDAQITTDSILSPGKNGKWILTTLKTFEKEDNQKSLKSSFTINYSDVYRSGLHLVPGKTYTKNQAVFKQYIHYTNNSNQVYSVRDTTIDKKAVLNAVNQIRAKGCNCGDKNMHTATKLKWNSTLEKIAFQHAKDMYLRKYYKHVSPEGHDHGDRLKEIGIRASSGENIAMGQVDGMDAFDAWLKSPGHCQNMMDPMYISIGVARYIDRYCMVISGPFYR